MGERVNIVTSAGAASEDVPIANGAGGYAWGPQSGGGGGGSVTSPDGTISVTSGTEIDVVYGTASNTAAEGNDSRITGALQKSGGTMSGALAMGSSKITGLENGSASSDAAAFGQIPTAGSSTPEMDGTGSAGSASTWSKSDHVHPTDTSRAPLASPALTGTPTAPTASSGTNTTQLATTAFVQTAAGLLVPLSTVTAKGDLIVGTGNGTVNKEAVGANGQVLTADSTQTTGVKWAAVSGGGSLGSYQALTAGTNISLTPPAGFDVPGVALAAGVCYLRGVLVSTGSTTANTALATLPVGWRPGNKKIYICASDTAATALMLTIDSSGNIACPSGQGGSGNHFGLDGINFQQVN